MQFVSKIRVGLLAVALPTFVLTGCKEEDKPAPAPDKKDTTPTTKPSVPAIPATMPAAVSDAVDKAKETAGGFADRFKEATGGDKPKVETPKVDVPKVDTPKVETPKVETPKVETPAASDKTAEATKLLTQVAGYIKDNKYDLAEKALAQLDGMKSSLPAEYGPKIDALKTSLNAVKGTGGVKLPDGVPGLPK